MERILYGAEEITFRPFHPGNVMAGSALKIALEHDGGIISGRVTEKEEKPGSQSAIVVMPDVAPTTGEFAGMLEIARADQNGEFKTRALKPGKYRVLALRYVPERLTPEFVEKLQTMRVNGNEVVLKPSGTIDLELEVKASF